MAPFLPEGTPVWLRAHNAYYRGELIASCRARGWDYSVSLTDTPKRGPVLDVDEGLPEEGWSTSEWARTRRWCAIARRAERSRVTR